jgi:NRPS condensation-like uncharacterized protein
MRKINSSWKKHKLIFDYEDFREIRRAYSNNYTYGVLTIEMAEEETSDFAATNLGRLDFSSKYGPFELDKFYFVPSAGPFLEIVLGVATVGGKLTITINYVEEKISKATVRAIKDQAMKCLDSIN